MLLSQSVSDLLLLYCTVPAYTSGLATADTTGCKTTSLLYRETQPVCFMKVFHDIESSSSLRYEGFVRLGAVILEPLGIPLPVSCSNTSNESLSVSAPLAANTRRKTCPSHHDFGQAAKPGQVARKKNHSSYLYFDQDARDTFFSSSSPRHPSPLTVRYVALDDRLYCSNLPSSVCFQMTHQPITRSKSLGTWVYAPNRCTSVCLKFGSHRSRIIFCRPWFVPFFSSPILLHTSYQLMTVGS